MLPDVTSSHWKWRMAGNFKEQHTLIFTLLFFWSAIINDKWPSCNVTRFSEAVFVCIGTFLKHESDQLFHYCAHKQQGNFNASWHFYGNVLFIFNEHFPSNLRSESWIFQKYKEESKVLWNGETEWPPVAAVLHVAIMEASLNINDSHYKIFVYYLAIFPLKNYHFKKKI